MKDADTLVFPIQLEIEKDLKISIGEISSLDMADYPPYIGPYEAVSLPYTDQILHTSNTYVNHNIKINKIPYAEVENDYGTTISISS